MSQELSAQKSSTTRTRSNITATRVDTIAIIGLGYVGLPLAILSAERGYKIVGFDIDEVKIAQLERREATFLSIEESQAFKSATSMKITGDEKNLDQANIYIKCI